MLTNDLITLHGVHEDLFLKTHAEVGGCPVPTVPQPCQDMGNVQTTIVMPTSNRYTEACRTTLSLLNEFWPRHPPVHVVALDHAIAPQPDDNAWVFWPDFRNASPGRKPYSGIWPAGRSMT